MMSCVWKEASVYESTAIVPPQILENLLVLALRQTAGNHIQTVVSADFYT